MVVKRIALIVVFALLTVGVGGPAGAEEATDRGFGGVAVASVDRPLAVQTDAAVAIVPQNPGELIGALIGLVIAHAGIAAAGPIMHAAIAAGETAFWVWQIGKNIWDAACDLGQRAEAVLELHPPTFIYVCTLYPRWPF